MPLVNDKIPGVGGQEARDAFDQAMESKREILRQRIIAARGSTYTYKDPDAVANRAGASISDQGAITFSLPSSTFIEPIRRNKKGKIIRSGFNNTPTTPPPTDNVGFGGDGGFRPGVGSGSGRARMGGGQVGDTRRGDVNRSSRGGITRQSIFDKLKERFKKLGT